jgi:hypothetical protein
MGFAFCPGWPGPPSFYFILPAVAGMTGRHHHAQLLTGSQELLSWAALEPWPSLISASPVARIIGMNQMPSCLYHLNRAEYYLGVRRSLSEKSGMEQKFYSRRVLRWEGVCRGWGLRSIFWVQMWQIHRQTLLTESPHHVVKVPHEWCLSICSMTSWGRCVLGVLYDLKISRLGSFDIGKAEVGGRTVLWKPKPTTLFWGWSWWVWTKKWNGNISGIGS